jgi:hypothetical protein
VFTYAPTEIERKVDCLGVVFQFVRCCDYGSCSASRYSSLVWATSVVPGGYSYHTRLGRLTNQLV